MKQVLEYGNLNIATITEYVTELDGVELIPELGSYNNLTKEVPNVLGTYVFKPGKVYTAITDFVLTTEDLQKLSGNECGYESIAPASLKLMNINPDMVALPVAKDQFILVYTFSVVQTLRCNIKNLNFGDVYFDYDDNNTPPFITKMVEEYKKNFEVTPEEEFDYENDMKVLDKADEEYQKHLEEQEKMQELSSNSLTDIFDKAAEKMLEGSEEVEAELEDEE